MFGTRRKAEYYSKLNDSCGSSKYSKLVLPSCVTKEEYAASRPITRHKPSYRFIDPKLTG